MRGLGKRPAPRPDVPRRVLVTGGSSGIGLACARALGERGSTVALVARGGQALEDAARSLRPRGLAIVVASIAGRVAVPWLAAYAAAKHGVRGFVRSLQAELSALGSPVRVGLVVPGPVDTPFWRRARTPDRRLPPELPGVYRPDDVAAEVVRALASPRTERTVGAAMAAWALLDAVAPNLTLRLAARSAKLGWRAREESPPSPSDALSTPAIEVTETGALRSRVSVARKVRDLIGIGR